MKKWINQTFSISALLPLLMFTLLTACGPIAPAKPTIQQGNEITQKELSHIHVGMTKEQVAASIGSPILLNIFRQEEWHYVYTTESEGHPFKETLVTIHFANNRVSNIEKKDY